VLPFELFVQVLPHLMDILHHHLERADNSAASSVLMLLTKIARDESRTRAIFMMRLFPRWKEVFDSNDGEVRKERDEMLLFVCSLMLLSARV
jgi:hypothetical protein